MILRCWRAIHAVAPSALPEHQTLLALYFTIIGDAPESEMERRISGATLEQRSEIITTWNVTLSPCTQ